MFLGLIHGSHNLQADRPGESSDIGINSEAFASASVQARIDADLELDELAHKLGKKAALAQNN